MLDNAINILIPIIIIYSFKASIARITFLHFVELVCIMFLIKMNSATLSNSMPITSTNPIWELRSLLLVKDPSTKI